MGSMPSTVKRTKVPISDDERIHNNRQEGDRPYPKLLAKKVVCHECGNKYKKIGSHWSAGSCSYPLPEPWKKEVITGIIMGDGCISVPKGNLPYIQITMTNKPFLEWLDNIMGWITTGGVRKTRSASQQAEMHRDNGFNPKAKAENYNNVYKLQTIALPWFKLLQSWYSSGEKRFPEELKLTPTIAKLWYVCDGCLRWSVEGGRTYVDFATTKEIERTEYLTSLFEEHGWNTHINGHTITISRPQTEQFLEWMGDPTPGFEYKWSTESRTEYERLRGEAYE